MVFIGDSIINNHMDSADTVFVRLLDLWVEMLQHCVPFLRVGKAVAADCVSY